MVWVLGQVKHDGWDLGGVFSTHEAAAARCESVNDCVWPVTVDEFLGTETVEPPDCRYPLAET